MHLPVTDDLTPDRAWDYERKCLILTDDHADELIELNIDDLPQDDPI
ncbi:hypothetical protein [uncultured Shimia sp.]|nr:hypothetical protein [uncultured Shimia sp.]